MQSNKWRSSVKPETAATYSEAKQNNCFVASAANPSVEQLLRTYLLT